MILAYLPFAYLYLSVHTTLAAYLSRLHRYLSTENLLPLLRPLYKMVLDGVDCMPTLAIFCHGFFAPSLTSFETTFLSHILAKAFRLKGEGFRPGEWK